MLRGMQAQTHDVVSVTVKQRDFISNGAHGNFVTLEFIAKSEDGQEFSFTCFGVEDRGIELKMGGA